DLRPVSMPTEYSWIGDSKEQNMYKRGSRSENSLLRYLSDDKILVIQEEPLAQKDNKRDTGRRSRKKGKPTSSPNYPISPSVLTSTINVRLEPGQQDVLNFSLAENNTVPLYHSFHYASLRVKSRKWSKGNLPDGSRRRISCKDLGHGDCEGWLWKKKDAKGYFTQKWKKYWFILKDSSLYWYTNQNDEKAEGFISLPEFRIDRAIECRRKHAFKACHPKIKSFYFATDCLEEMNRWMNRLGLAAIGYTPDDKDIHPDEDYWSESDQDDIDGSLTLKQEASSTLCDTYHRTPSVNSSSPFPEAKQGRHFSSESTYSHSSAEDSRQDVAGSTHSSGCRPPYRERRSWQDLIETPLTSSGLHFLQTVPPDAEYVSGRPGMSPDRRRQATLPEIGENTDGLQELYKSLEQASLSAFGEQRPSTKQEFRRSFVKRCNDPVINEKLHHIRVLKSTLKAKEGDLTVINSLLDDPNITSKKFKDWKLKNYEFFLDICEYSAAVKPQNGASELASSAPMLTHTHSFIETHV
ncbi:PREDICTED: connector enhancer of kinase suppressor of ras 2-like, partial [Buceros rhinoceros silvestris]|uniref:connector enhancer of kinase suppressor of ras 2-like n=1 Tax=Buceros rhinoceros silvestris TaxID=175836 RepID=UPI00052949D8